MLSKVNQVGEKYVFFFDVDGSRVEQEFSKEEWESAIKDSFVPQMPGGIWTGGGAILSVFDTPSGELEPGTFFIAPDGSVAANFKGKYTTLEPGTISPDGGITKVSKTFCKDCVAPTEADIK